MSKFGHGKRERNNKEVFMKINSSTESLLKCGGLAPTQIRDSCLGGERK
jgi:hypothetical protein